MRGRVPVALLALGLFLFSGLPLLAVLGRAGPADYLRAFQDPLARAALRNTVWISAAAAALAVAIGAPLAWLVARTDVSGRHALCTLLSLPAAVPPYLWAMAWIDLAHPRSGLLHRAARAVGLALPAPDPYSAGGMVWVLAVSTYPMVLLGTAAALSRIDPALEEAARVCGAGRLRVLKDVTLPLCLPAIAAGGLLVFVAAAAAFGVPALLGTGSAEPTFVLTTLVYHAVLTGGEAELARAAALSGALLFVAGAAWLLGAWLQKPGRHAVVGGKAHRGAPSSLGCWRAPLAALGWGFAALVVVAPLGAVALASLLKSWGGPLDARNLTLANWRHVLGLAEVGRAAKNSLLLACAAATVATLVGATVAWVESRTRAPGRRALAMLASWPYAAPGTVLAIGFIVVFYREVRLVLAERLTVELAMAGSLWALFLAYMVKHLALPARAAAAGLAQIDRTLEEAARVAGAGPTRAVRDVTVPLLAPSLAAAWVLVFLPSLSELTMSVLLFGPGTEVLGTVLFELHSYGDPPAGAVLAVLIVALVLAGNFVARKLSGGRLGF